MEVRVQPTYVTGTAGPVLLRLEIVCKQMDGFMVLKMKTLNVELANALADELRQHVSMWSKQ